MIHPTVREFLCREWANADAHRHHMTFDKLADALRGIARSLDGMGFDVEAEEMFFLVRLAIVRQAMECVQWDLLTLDMLEACGAHEPRAWR